MRFCCLVLIAAVAVNSLVTTINARSSSNTVKEPFNMLLPPLVDKTEDVTEAVAVAKTNAKAAEATATTVAPLNKDTTKATTKSKTALKPLTNDVNNVALPELSIEALLPPLYEAKIEKAENNNKQQTATTADETTTFSINTVEITTEIPTTQPRTTTTKATTTTTTATTTTTKKTTTKAPRTTTTTTITTKAYAITPPALSLEALLPPLVGVVDGDSGSATTIRPDETKKSFLQEKKQQKLKNEIHSPKVQEIEISSQGYNETPTEDAQALNTNAIPQNIVRGVESFASNDLKANNNKYRSALNNLGFDFYLGSTTPRPPKEGLPTITPFPHRLR